MVLSTFKKIPRPTRKPQVCRAVSFGVTTAGTQHSAAFTHQHTHRSKEWRADATSARHPSPPRGPQGPDTPGVLYASHKVVLSVLRFKNPRTDWNQPVTGKASSRIPLNKCRIQLVMVGNVKPRNAKPRKVLPCIAKAVVERNAR